MTDPFLAEIRIFAGNYAPSGWALCNGQLMPISQNTALFSLLGVNYGGDGRSSFGLPNLTGSAPMQQGQGTSLSQRVLGQIGGQQTVSLVASSIPMHTHTVAAVNAAGDSNIPTGAVPAQGRYGRMLESLYSTGSVGDTTMNGSALGSSGGGQPHNNMPPYLCVTFIIALQGIFPPRP